MSDAIKFTTEELKAIAALQEKYGTVTFHFGQLWIEKEAIEKRMTQNAIEFENTKKELEGIRTEEQALGQSLQKKYGDGQLNLSTGEFTPTTSVPIQS